MPIIKSTEKLEVGCQKALFYGDAGSGKTTFVSASPDTLILDFDGGAHRALKRADVMRMANWQEVVATLKDKEIMAEYNNIVFDTVATALDLLTLELVRQNPRNGNAVGGLSQQGWAALATTFTQEANKVIAQGKNLIMVAHAKEEKDGDNRYYRPLIPGSSKDFIARISDSIGYMYKTQADTYILDFSCPEKAVVKDTGNLGRIVVPNLGLPENRTFFSDMLKSIADAIHAKSAAQDEAIDQILEFKNRLSKFTKLSQFNGELPALNELIKTDKGMAIQLKTILDQAAPKTVIYNKTTKAYEKLPAKLQEPEPTDDEKAAYAEAEANEAAAAEEVAEEVYEW